MKGEAVFKRVFNQALEQLVGAAPGAPIDSESGLARTLGASRTTVRKVLGELERRRVIDADGGGRTLARAPVAADYFARAETVPTAARIEKRFMEWMLRADRRPGDGINEAELAREAGVSTSGIREYLNRFSRFGLIEKRHNSGWLFRGFTREFALELFEVRELFETRSAIAFATQPRAAPAWRTLAELEVEHRALLETLETRYHDFSDLDERFHRLVNDASQNRFIVDFYDVISLIFHYHYQWNKADERQRNQAAILEHLDYIEALFSRDPGRIEMACKSHLKSARKTLLASIDPISPT
jgi:DNA-binding GntR family transcriptional regulator